MRRPPVALEEAETIALSGLAMLADAPERMGRFFELSGLDATQIRELATTAAFQTAVLAFIRSDESLLLAFASNLGIDPARVADAEVLLSGSPARR